MNASEFMQTLYGQCTEGWLEATFIAPKEIKLYPRTVVFWKSLPLRGIRMENILEYNQRGYGAYFGLAVRKNRKPEKEERINEKTGEKRIVLFPRGWQVDALYLTAFFVDVDGKDYPHNGDALAAVRDLKPSIIVSSGGGYHGYLLLDQPLLITDANRTDIKRTLKGLSKSIGADPHVAELARVFRFPDTVNTKPGRENALCRVMETNPVRYTYEELFEEYAPLIPMQNTLQRTYESIDETEVGKALDCIPADRISYDEWIKILAGLTHSLGETEAERLGERWSGWCSEPGEIGSKVASFDKNTGSMTASIASVFQIARRFGYERTFSTPLSGGASMTMNNKVTQAQHLSAFGS